MLLFDERVQITEFNGEDLYQDLLATTLHNDSADLDTVPVYHYSVLADPNTKIGRKL